MSYSPKTFAVVSDLAARVEAALDEVKDPIAKETARQLADHHAKVREMRRIIESKRPEKEQGRGQLAYMKSRMKAAVDGSISMGAAFKLDTIESFGQERSSDDAVSAADLENLFRSHGELGKQVSKKLGSLSSEYRKVVEHLRGVEIDLAKIDRDYSAEFFKLQGLISTAKGVLQVNGLPIPTLKVGRPSKKGKAAADPQAAPALTVVPAPAAESNTLPVAPVAA